MTIADRKTVIKVAGVGCAGVRALEIMIAANVPGIEYITVDTDARTLKYSKAQTKVHLGKQAFKGFGSGSKSALARKAAYEELKEIGKVLIGTDLVVIIAGLGGGTGSGASVVLADAANTVGALTIGVVTLPFSYEGKKRMALAEEAICELANRVDALIVIPNDSLIANRKTLELYDVFKASDEILADAVIGILSLLSTDGIESICFEDIKNMLSGHAHVIMGIGVASGANRGQVASEKSMKPLCSVEFDVTQAKKVLVIVTASSELTNIEDYTEVKRIFDEKLSVGTKIITRMCINDRMDNDITVTAFYSYFDNHIAMNNVLDLSVFRSKKTVSFIEVDEVE